MRIKVLGPPGCGKTTAVLNYVKEYSVRDDINSIVCCSFTKAASNVTYERLVKAGLDKKAKAATIHSLAFEHMHYRKPYMVNTLFRFARSIGEKVGAVDDKRVYVARTPLERSLSYYQIQRSLMTYGDTPLPSGLSFSTVQAYITAFEKYKSSNNFSDYNDVLLKYLQEGEPLDYDVAFIDEAQDLSPLQWAVTDKMFQRAKDVVAVGDDDQTIFAFAGVRSQVFIDWPCDEVITLKETHRFGQDIFAYTCHVLERIVHRIPKVYTPSSRPSRVSITNGIIPELDITPYASVAILHRNRYLVQKTQAMLNQWGFTYGGTGSPFISQGQMKAIKRWEEWRRGAELQVYHVHSMAKYIPRHLLFDRMEEKGKRLLAGPCPYPNRPWYDILALQYQDIYVNVQNLHGFDYLITPPIITATTIHQSKGGEWDKVIVIPDMSAATYLDFKRGVDSDTEHRVWFVALTRAILHLQIVKPSTTKFYPLEGFV